MRFFWWKPHVWQNSGSLDMGAKVVKKGLFLNFLENVSFVFLDIVHVDRGQYCASFTENRMSGKILVL